MRNFGKFITKHLLLYLLILVFIVVLDLVVFFLTFNNTVEDISRESPVRALQKVSENFTSENGS